MQSKSGGKERKAVLADYVDGNGRIRRLARSIRRAGYSATGAVAAYRLGLGAVAGDLGARPPEGDGVLHASTRWQIRACAPRCRQQELKEPKAVTLSSAPNVTSKCTEPNGMRQFEHGPQCVENGCRRRRVSGLWR